MPRSGSTLLENILSLNQDVVDLGEIEILSDIVDQSDPSNKEFNPYKKYIDQVIDIPPTHTEQKRIFLDGVYSTKKLAWKNHSRPDCYNLTPFDETIVLDVDFIICNDKLLNCFK